MEIWLPRDKQWFLADIALGVREEKKNNNNNNNKNNNNNNIHMNISF
jgi:hypothetical protein